MIGPTRFGRISLADDPEVARAQGAAGLDELALAQRQREAAHDASDVRPAEEGYDEDHDAEPGLSASPMQPFTLVPQATTIPIAMMKSGDGEHDVEMRESRVSVHPPK